MSATSNAVALNDITIAYDDVGSGDAVLFVHGHPFNRSMWAGQLETLRSAGWRAIAPDLRGYGETTVVPGKTTLDVFARDLAALLDDLQIERVVIGGLSMGGQIVMEFARLFPERVRAVLLIATSPGADDDSARVVRRAMADRLDREGMRGYSEEVLAKMLAPANIAAMPHVADGVMRMMLATPNEGAAAAVRGRTERPPYESVLAKLAVPALIVVGDQDPFTPPAQAELMHELIVGSKLVQFEGVAHMPNLERASEFDAVMLEFLNGLR